MGTAKRVKSTLKEFKGEAHLYKVDPPASYYTGYTGPEHTTEYVVVSAVNVPFIFPADEEGSVLDWGELEGSHRGDYTHEHALEEAGYKLIE